MDYCENSFTGIFPHSFPFFTHVTYCPFPSSQFTFSSSFLFLLPHQHAFLEEKNHAKTAMSRFHKILLFFYRGSERTDDGDREALIKPCCHTESSIFQMGFLCHVFRLFREAAAVEEDHR